MLSRRIILLILVITGILGGASFFSLIIYFDPYVYKKIAIMLLFISFSLSFVSFSTIIFYFFKKIYYRGNTGIYHIITSMRQSFFISLFLSGCVLLLSLKIPYILPGILLFAVLLFLELFIQSL